jgi:hypothetical protein
MAGIDAPLAGGLHEVDLALALVLVLVAAHFFLLGGVFGGGAFGGGPFASGRRAGFVGWVRWEACPHALAGIERSAGGVYVIYRADPADPAYLDSSPAGTFRGDPTVPARVLEANWVPGARVVYIGKANHGRLRKRLEEFIDFGRGGIRRHWGGRLIWQLQQSEKLLVAWRSVPPDVTPKEIEDDMIYSFRQTYGKAPFANDPHLLGR